MGRRETGVAYVLLVLGGFFGLHKFYLNQVALGIIYFFTGGLFFIGILVDLFTLPSQVEQCNWEIDRQRGWRERTDAFDERMQDRQSVLRDADRRLQDFDRRLNNVEAVINAKRN